MHVALATYVPCMFSGCVHMCESLYTVITVYSYLLQKLSTANFNNICIHVDALLPGAEVVIEFYQPPCYTGAVG